MSVEKFSSTITWYDTSHKLPIPFCRVLGLFKLKDCFSFQLCELREIKPDQFVWSQHGHREPLMWTYMGHSEAQKLHDYFLGVVSGYDPYSDPEAFDMARI